MKVIGLIPARYDSKRFPGKLLTKINGEPLIKHVYDKAVACPEFNFVSVVTGDQKIANELEEYGISPFISQQKHCCGTDQIREAAQIMRLEKEDIVINIQGDQFMFHPTHITMLVEYLKLNTCRIATLAVPKKDKIGNRNTVKVLTDRMDFALYFSRLPLCCRILNGKQEYLKHIGIYGYKYAELMEMPTEQTALEQIERLEQLRWMEHGHKIKVLRTKIDSHSIDVPGDIE